MRLIDKTGLIFLCITLIALSGLGRDTALAPNFRLFPSLVTQSETFIARHPMDGNIFFVSCNTVNLSTGFISEGIYVSSDGGLSWTGSDTCSGAPISFHRGDPGIAIDKNGRFLLIRLGTFPGLYSHYSSDAGLSWSGQNTIATNDQDRATLTSDAQAASPHYGRSYACWVRFAPPFPVFSAFTDDGGENWSTPAQVNNPSQRNQGGEIAIGPSGEVYTCWVAVISQSPFTEDYVGFARSNDGGSSWTVNENAFDINGIAGILPEKGNIRVNGLPRMDVDRSGGSNNGRIYVVTTQRNLAPAGADSDVVLYYSDDSGDSWSAGIRVHQDVPNNGKIQYFPALHVSDDGVVNVLYYDDRNTASDSSEVYLSRSADGGVTWEDWLVSDHRFKPVPIGQLGQGYQGDNIGISSGNDYLLPVWMDNSTGNYQLWSSRIPFAEVGIAEVVAPQTIQMLRNYPNPFNPETSIAYELVSSGDIVLEIFDLHGRRMRVFQQGRQSAGRYTLRWDGHNDAGQTAASGVYLYRLRIDGATAQTRKMVLLR